MFDEMPNSKETDGFGPREGSKDKVRCIHCGEEYEERLVRWDEKAALWVCKNWPECDGAGVNVDLWRLDKEGNPKCEDA